jgi:hypothetical protein
VWKFVEKVRVRQDDLINTSVAYFSIEKTHVFFIRTRSSKIVCLW